jgi:DNA-binding NtrC family response regulator
MNYTDTKYSPPSSYLSEAFPFLRRTARGRFVVPNGLVVTPDYNKRGNLGEALLLCGVAPIFAGSIADAAHHLATSPITFIVCDHRLPDGSYDELLSLSRASVTPPPLVVISTTGDWPDYFQAIDRGAYDFLAYPLIPGELQRIVSAYLKLNPENSTQVRSFD